VGPVSTFFDAGVKKQSRTRALHIGVMTNILVHNRNQGRLRGKEDKRTAKNDSRVCALEHAKEQCHDPS